jgi:hypothetical protein
MSGASEQGMERQLRDLFGADASCEGPLSPSGAGIRLTGVDLRPQLTPEQVGFLLDALSRFGIVTMPGQDLDAFSLAHFERFANHWGAPIPHPNNFLRGGKRAQSDGDSDGPIEWIPFERRRAAAVNASFPDRLQCLAHESPTVLVVSNFSGAPSATLVGPSALASQRSSMRYAKKVISALLTSVTSSARQGPHRSRLRCMQAGTLTSSLLWTSVIWSVSDTVTPWPAGGMACP